MICDLTIFLVIYNEHHSVMSPPLFEKVLILISQLGRLLVADINIVGILHIVFLIDKGEERIGVYPCSCV